MTTPRSRESRREAARAREQGGSSSKLLLPILGGAVLLIAAVAAIVLTSGGGDGNGAASTAVPSAGTSAGPVGPEATPVVTGTSLPVFADSAGDAAVGMTIPTVTGSDFDGVPVSIAIDGRPKVLLFLAHWCNHCQAEVPIVQDWIDAGEAPDDVDLIAVATSIDSGAPNYPPEAWLEREGWTVPTLVDRPGSVAAAYGLSAFPFWVFVDGEGKVTGRLTGRLDVNALETIIDSIR